MFTDEACLRSLATLNTGSPCERDSAAGIESKYLLTGLVQCGVCGGGVYVASRSHGKKRALFYGCTTFHRKGQAVCANYAQMVMEDGDWAVMEGAQDELLDPAVVRMRWRRPSPASLPRRTWTSTRVWQRCARGRT